MQYYFDNTRILLYMTKEDEGKFNNVTECWLCNQPLAPLSLIVDMDGKVLGKDRDH